MTVTCHVSRVTRHEHDPRFRQCPKFQLISNQSFAWWLEQNEMQLRMQFQKIISSEADRNVASPPGHSSSQPNTTLPQHFPRQRND